MTDPHLEGGILAFKKAAALAHAGGLPIVNHAFSPATITMHAQLSVMGSTPGLILANQGHQDLLAGDVVTPLEYTDGRMRISTSPGLAWSWIEPASSSITTSSKGKVSLLPMPVRPRTR